MSLKIPSDRKDVLAAAGSGLSGAEAEARLARFGPNRILEAAPGGWRDVVLDALRDPMLWFLLGTSVLFGMVGDHAEALVLLVALVPLFGMDAWLHRRTQASLAGLGSRLATDADVVRDGHARKVPAADLVPGDIVLLAAGDAVPADGVLLTAERLQIDESTLTGESYPVRKVALPEGCRTEFAVADEHWLLAGTRALTGTARLAIVSTGAETRYGEIVRSAARTGHERTPLQHAVAGLVKVLIFVAMVMCVVLAWVRLHQGHDLMDAILSAVTLAVAALPEEFPVVLTVFLGVGIFRLAQRQALVRRAVVVENIGRVTCICTDKTGTLTEGRLRLAHRIPAAGLAPEALLRFAAIASRRESGDPMDLAILDTGTAPEPVPAATFPFTEDRRRETGIVEEHGELLAAVKGAPEVVLAMCDLGAAERAGWADETEALAASGHKVIAVARRPLAQGPWSGGEPDRGFRFAGLLAFEDPVRAGVAEALGACRSAGIRVIMVTGDHPATARAVARDIGLGSSPGVIDGPTLDTRLDTPGASLEGIDVIARAVPAQKMRLVRALQSQGEIVAVTGDGVNDVPALQAADVGIAMGGRGTRSAREAAAIVLLDDNFRSIVRAIGEGRQLFRNLQQSFQYLLTIHIPLVVTAAAIPFAGYPLLYLPVHIVWLELVIHPTALLVFQELPSGESLQATRSTRTVRFFDRWQALVIVLTGIVTTLVVTASFVRSLGIGYEVEHARTMALVALTLAGTGITAALTRLRSRTARRVTMLSVLLTVVLVQVPWLAGHLALRPLHLDDWLIAIGGALVVAAIPTLAEGCLRTGSRFRRGATPEAS